MKLIAGLTVESHDAYVEQGDRTILVEVIGADAVPINALRVGAESANR